MSRLLKFAPLLLLVGLAGATPPPKPSNIVIAVSKDGSVKMTRNGKIITCQQFRDMNAVAMKARHLKLFDCKAFTRILKWR